MDLIKVGGTQPVIQYVADRLMTNLERGKAVLWMIGGGSVMQIAVEVTKKIHRSPNIEKLTVTLTDERFGPTGHKDSNWQQLSDLGFKLSGAAMKPVLTGKTLEATRQEYQKFILDQLNNSVFSIALAGMGPDGHIFGIKPASPAVEGEDFVSGYSGSDYTRLTPTIKLITQLDEVVVYAVGRSKWRQLDRLESNLEAELQPAQMFKKMRQVTIFNDYKGGEI